MPAGPLSARRSRLFFALPADAERRRALAALAADIALTADGRATHAASIHLTLAFVGAVDAIRVRQLMAIGDSMSGEACALTLSRFGSFPRTRVAWIAPASVAPPLSLLQRALVVALAADGFSADRLPFTPHVTLARHCRRAFAASVHEPALQWPVTSFALWASSPSGGGRYDEIARWPLA